MTDIDLKRVAKSNLAQAIATRASDPYFTAALKFLPNPDPVLRKLNRGQEAFDAIGMDAHVLGELRSVRSALLGYEWRIEAGGDSPADQRALEIAEMVLSRPPAPGGRWPDVIWTMALAVFRGFSIHEVVWERADSLLMPQVFDRPQRRFLFGSESNELRLLTRTSPAEGIAIDDRTFLCTRHMPSQENPYGVAVFSACFWPYTFKHSGFRYFVKFSEKYGLPWAIGKYPPGTPKDEQDKFADALRDMIEDAIAAIEEGQSVELQTPNSGTGSLPQERLIKACNAEMSKALTSQTLATEIQGEGSRAASETHRGREQAVNESDRAIVADTMNQLFAWVTELNVAGAQPPRFEFYEEGEARKEWVEVIDSARGFMDIPTRFAHERLQIPTAEAGEDTLPREGARPIGGGQTPGQAGQFQRNVCPGCGASHEFALPAFPDQAELERMIDSIGNGELQEQAEKLLEPLFDLVRKHPPDEALGLIAEAYPDMDDDALQELLARVLFVADTWGRLNA